DSHAHSKSTITISGENVTAGTIADARIASTIARDSELPIGDCGAGTFVQNTTSGSVECATPVGDGTGTDDQTYAEIGSGTATSKTFRVGDSSTLAATGTGTITANDTVCTDCLGTTEIAGLLSADISGLADVDLNDDFGEFTCTGAAQGCTLDTGSFDDEYIELGDNFIGDVTGPYSATIVGDDSHTHTKSTITISGENITAGTINDNRLDFTLADAHADGGCADCIDGTDLKDTITLDANLAINSYDVTVGEDLKVSGNLNVTGNVTVGKGLFLGRYSSKPSCGAAQQGMLVFDTVEVKPYVCSGSTWKPLDSDYDSDGITDAIDTNDANPNDATAVEADVRTGETFYAGGAARTGSMNDCSNGGSTCYANGGYWASAACASQGSQSCWPTGSYYAATTQTLSAASTTVNQGYYTATTLTAVDADLATGNIKSGTNIFGIAGNSNVVDTSGGNIDSTARIRSGYTCYSDGTSYAGSLANCGLGGSSCYANGGYWYDTSGTVSNNNQIKSGYAAFSDGTKYTGTYTPTVFWSTTGCLPNDPCSTRCTGTVTGSVPVTMSGSCVVDRYCLDDLCLSRYQRVELYGCADPGKVECLCVL
ncbi:MAG: hypothetical protein KJ685_01790, partial [Nanoarchaeota archaeon]|nr:hypothetical protein [Nanoarchaeota archaeon]